MIIEVVEKGEAWAMIREFPNYWISNHGRVINFVNRSFVNPSKNNKGYLRVSLPGDARIKTKHVHRLVAEAFVPNPCGYPEVNHIDEDKTNPYFKNLEWVTSQMNSEHSLAQAYTFMSPEGKEVRVFNLSKFARDNKLNASLMYKVGNGKIKQYKGWRLYEDR